MDKYRRLIGVAQFFAERDTNARDARFDASTESTLFIMPFGSCPDTTATISLYGAMNRDAIAAFYMFYQASHYLLMSDDILIV